MGGYIFIGKDKTTEVQAASLAALQDRMTHNEIADAITESRTSARYDEIIRRLERIERGVDARRRQEAP